MAAAATAATRGSSWRELGSVPRPLARALGTSGRDAWYGRGKMGAQRAPEAWGWRLKGRRPGGGGVASMAAVPGKGLQAREGVGNPDWEAGGLGNREGPRGFPERRSQASFWGWQRGQKDVGRVVGGWKKGRGEEVSQEGKG